MIVYKYDKITVLEVKDNCSIEPLIEFDCVWRVAVSKWAFYTVKNISVSCGYLNVYVTPPNDGYKKADY